MVERHALIGRARATRRSNAGGSIDRDRLLMLRPAGAGATLFPPLPPRMSEVQEGKCCAVGTLAQCQREGRRVLRAPWLCGRARPPHVHRPATGPISTCGARGAFAFAASDAPSSGAHFAVDIGGESRLVASRAAGRGGFVDFFFLTVVPRFPYRSIRGGKEYLW